MSQYFEEVYFDVEKAIELAFDSKYVLNFYEYLKLKGVKKNRGRSIFKQFNCTRNCIHY